MPSDYLPPVTENALLQQRNTQLGHLTGDILCVRVEASIWPGLHTSCSYQKDNSHIDRSTGKQSKPKQCYGWACRTQAFLRIAGRIERPRVTWTLDTSHAKAARFQDSPHHSLQTSENTNTTSRIGKWGSGEVTKACAILWKCAYSDEVPIQTLVKPICYESTSERHKRGSLLTKRCVEYCQNAHDLLSKDTYSFLAYQLFPESRRVPITFHPRADDILRIW